MDCCQPLENEMGGFHQSQNDWNTRGVLCFGNSCVKLERLTGTTKKNEPAACIEREFRAADEDRFSVDYFGREKKLGEMLTCRKAEEEKKSC
jgi:hypothetical protein